MTCICKEESFDQRQGYGLAADVFVTRTMMRGASTTSTYAHHVRSPAFPRADLFAEPRRQLTGRRRHRRRPHVEAMRGPAVPMTMRAAASARDHRVFKDYR